MDPPYRRPPKRKEDRIILQFDYDCFYAQVFENKDPTLKTKPLGVRQKNILATCNYPARKLGVGKLMLVTEAKRLCPRLVLVDGEDLTAFRDMSKTLFNFLLSHSWNGKAERLGFDEVFMDVTDLVEYNLLLLNHHALEHSFFFLSEKDPEKGFPFDGTTIPGCTEGVALAQVDCEAPHYLRLMLGSHLAFFLRTRLEEDFGYTSTCGISTNKVLSKLAGARNKPRNQTTLLTLSDDHITAFMDSHKLRSVPGVGFKAASLLEAHVTQKKVDETIDSHSFDGSVMVAQARTCPSVTPALLESLLGGPGAEKGVGSRIWGLLHGVDPSELKEPNNVPSQISIEDTYKGLENVRQISEELHKLAYSLIRRMRVDLVVDDDDDEKMNAQKWLARPRTLRLAIRSWPEPGSLRSQSYSRISRSGPLPNFVFDLTVEMEDLAERLLSESLLPLLRRLEPEKGPRWNLQLINICVANMAQGATNDKHGAGRDIANMFKNQEEALRPWKVVEEPILDEPDGTSDVEFIDEEDDVGWETTNNDVCPVCQGSIPVFAIRAHMRFHEMEG